MRTQYRRHWNLARLLSGLELAGHLTPDAQSKALGGIVTSRRLLRIVLGGRIHTDTARAIEHRLNLPRRWMDQEPTGRAVSDSVQSQEGESPDRSAPAGHTAAPS
ncbi:hypothetical protein [Luteibacter sp. CQ10]|uniref:hypothetical protein n=1 Tax=Luteibacter sp. CQ10 TaxID=2805821 RepID=UPI0034A37D3B